ncbi:fimbrial biogenesis chaperone [Enterobacter wuhouensis]|uniref:fimbrial biogenesis chaperone n=1 Tax=Enterobacter wuhouensis TaxID=2529381 RepID=UPI00352699C9
MFKKYVLAGVGLILTSMAAHAGVVIGGTRFIFDQKKSSITFEVKNTSQTRFMVMSKVLDENGMASDKVPFIITPPLFTLSHGRSNLIRILRTGGDLPDDRESLFWLSVASIPETQGKQAENTLQVAIRSRMKLFYRPSGLQGKEEDAYKRVSWSKQGNHLRAANPTPYYVTLFNLRVDGHSIERAGMLSPFSSREIAGYQSDALSAVRWQSINDYGRVMPAQLSHVN